MYQPSLIPIQYSYSTPVVSNVFGSDIYMEVQRLKER
jgi:hypothetical protein